MKTASRRSLTSLTKLAIEGGRHRVEILPDGRITILPLGIDPLQADVAALDAEIRGHMSDGDARH